MRVTTRVVGRWNFLPLSHLVILLLVLYSPYILTCICFLTPPSYHKSVYNVIPRVLKYVVANLTRNNVGGTSLVNLIGIILVYFPYGAIVKEFPVHGGPFKHDQWHVVYQLHLTSNMRMLT